MSESNVAVADEKEQISLLDFLTAWEKSHQDGTGVQGVSDKTGLTKNTCQAKASKYRNPEFKKVNKQDAEGNTLYKRAIVGEDGEVETADKSLAKLTAQGKEIVVKVYAKTEAGKRIQVRKGLNLSTMQRGGTSRIASQMDAAEALLLKLQGKTPKADAEAAPEVAPADVS